MAVLVVPHLVGLSILYEGRQQHHDEIVVLIDSFSLSLMNQIDSDVDYFEVR